MYLTDPLSTMVNLSIVLAFMPLISTVESFAVFSQGPSLKKGITINTVPKTVPGKTHRAVATRVSMNAKVLDPSDVIPLNHESIITPEGLGFSSSIDRVMKSSDRYKGYYRAKASDLVVKVMDGMSEESMDVALVFDDESDELLGIFTETDYVRVCSFIHAFPVKMLVSSTPNLETVHVHYSFR